VNNFDDVISFHLFKIGDHEIDRQRSIAGAQYPISDEHQPRAHIVAELLHRSLPVAFENKIVGYINEAQFNIPQTCKNI